MPDNSPLSGIGLANELERRLKERGVRISRETVRATVKTFFEILEDSFLHGTSIVIKDFIKFIPIVKKRVIKPIIGQSDRRETIVIASVRSRVAREFKKRMVEAHEKIT